MSKSENEISIKITADTSNFTSGIKEVKSILAAKKITDMPKIDIGGSINAAKGLSSITPAQNQLRSTFSSIAAEEEKLKSKTLELANVYTAFGGNMSKVAEQSYRLGHEIANSKEKLANLKSEATQANTKLTILKKSMEQKAIKIQLNIDLAGMGESNTKIDILQTKLNALNSQMTAQKSIVSSLNKAYEESANAKGADALETEQLKLKMLEAKEAEALMKKETRALSEELIELKERFKNEDLIKEKEKLITKLKEERIAAQKLKAEYKAVADQEGESSKKAILLRNSLAQQNKTIESTSQNLKRIKLEINQYVAAAIRAESTTKKMTKSVNAASSGFSKMQSGIKKTSIVMDKLLIGTMNPLNISVGQFTTTLGVGFGAKSILDLNSGLEKAEVAFTTLTGTSQLAKKHISDLMNFAAKTPFKMEDIFAGSQRLQAFGLQTQQAIPIMEAFGNAVAAAGGDSETLSRSLLAVGQIQTKNRVQAEELLQLAEAGIPVYQILADKLGLTAKQVADIGNQGINANQAIQALTQGLNEKFGGAMKAQANSFSGLLTQITNELKKFFLEASGTGFENLKGKLSDFLEYLKKADQDGSLDQLASNIDDALGKMIDFLAETTEFFIEHKDSVILTAEAMAILYVSIKALNSLSNVITALKTIKKAIDGLRNAELAATAATKLTTALKFLANPATVSAIIGALAAMAVSFHQFGKEGETFTDFTLRTLGLKKSIGEMSAEVQSSYKKIENAIKSANLAGLTDEHIQKLDDLGVGVHKTGDKIIYTWENNGQKMKKVFDKTSKGLIESSAETTNKINEVLTKTGDLDSLKNTDVLINRTREAQGQLLLTWYEYGEEKKQIVSTADLELLKENYATEQHNAEMIKQVQEDQIKAEQTRLEKRKDMYKEIAELTSTPLQKELLKLKDRENEYRKAGLAEVDLAKYTAAKKAKIYKDSAEEIQNTNDDLATKILELNGKEIESKLFNLKKEFAELKKKGANEITLARYVVDSKKRIAEEYAKSQYSAEYNAVLDAIKSGGSLEEAYKKAHEEAAKQREEEAKALQYVQEKTGIFAGTMKKLITNYNTSGEGINIVQEDKLVGVKGKIEEMFDKMGKIQINVGDLSLQGQSAAQSYFQPFKAEVDKFKGSLATLNAAAAHIQNGQARQAGAGSVVNNNNFEINVKLDAKVYKEVDIEKTANIVADKIYNKVQGISKKYSY